MSQSNLDFFLFNLSNGLDYIYSIDSSSNLVFLGNNFFLYRLSKKDFFPSMEKLSHLNSDFVKKQAKEGKEFFIDMKDKDDGEGNNPLLCGDSFFSSTKRHSLSFCYFYPVKGSSYSAYCTSTRRLLSLIALKTKFGSSEILMKPVKGGVILYSFGVFSFLPRVLFVWFFYIRFFNLLLVRKKKNVNFLGLLKKKSKYLKSIFFFNSLSQYQTNDFTKNSFRKFFFEDLSSWKFSSYFFFSTFRNLNIKAKSFKRKISGLTTFLLKNGVSFFNVYQVFRLFGNLVSVLKENYPRFLFVFGIYLTFYARKVYTKNRKLLFSPYNFGNDISLDSTRKRNLENLFPDSFFLKQNKSYEQT